MVDRFNIIFLRGFDYVLTITVEDRVRGDDRCCDTRFAPVRECLFDERGWVTEVAIYILALELKPQPVGLLV